MKAQKSSPKKRTRAISGDRLEDLLDSLLIDQLRSVCIRLEIKASRQKKDELVESILTSGRSLASIASIAYETEAATPYSHSFLCFWSGTSLSKKLPKKVFKANLYSPLRELYFAHRFETDETQSFTFEHKVETTEWKYDEKADVKRRVSNTLRHPLICTFYKTEKVFIVNYPGFSQGLATKKTERLEYEKIIEQLLNIFSEYLEIYFANLPLKPVLDELSSLESPRLKIVKASPSTTSGKAFLSVDNSSKGQSIDDWLVTNLVRFAPDLDPAGLRLGVRKFIKELSNDDWVVFWNQEHVATRIRFWTFGTEMLFVWKGTEKTFWPLSNIMSLLVPLAQKSSKPAISAAWDFLIGKEIGDLTSPSQIASSVNGSLADIENAIKMALKAKLIEPIYRLKSNDLFLNYENSWTVELGKLAKIFELQDHSDFDGSWPENIEIAFRRTHLEAGK